MVDEETLATANNLEKIPFLASLADSDSYHDLKVTLRRSRSCGGKHTAYLVSTTLFIVVLAIFTIVASTMNMQLHGPHTTV